MMNAPCFRDRACRNPWICALAVSAAAGVSTAQPLSYNTGSLGTAGDGTHIGGPLLDQPGVLAAYDDFAVTYSAGSRTTVPFLAALNPPSGSPFTIEFWAKPVSSDNDDAPVANRIATGDRTGWVFFQRGPEVGYDFRLYAASGSSYGWDLEGGPYTLDQWTHVVGVWSGSDARLYVNGVLANATNRPGLSGVYAANPIDSAASIFSVGALFDGGSPSAGGVDEIAFYSSALTAQQIAAHFAARSSSEADAYASLVVADGAMEYLRQNPPTAQISLATGVPKVTFTGILSQSLNLTGWEDLTVTSPYFVPSPVPAKLFFRAHR